MLRSLIFSTLLVLAGPLLADVSGVIHVVDGDTVHVGQAKVRLHAIDAPEVDQMCGDAQSPAWACGAWVRNQARALFEGRMAECVQLDTDRYDRIVATCSVDGRDMGETLVSAGLAFAYRRYGLDYDLAEKAAAVNLRGLHATGVMTPSEFRSAQRAAQAPTQVRNAIGSKTVTPPGSGSGKITSLLNGLDPDCRIKGNINRSGDRIYHLPGQEYYDDTRISPMTGERWFCSESEARSAGWRKARK